MTSLVADTGPLNYLVQIGQTEIMPKIFGTVCVPQSVLDELRHPSAPDIVKQFGGHPPEWIQVVSLGEKLIATHPRLSRTDLETLLLAEDRSAILLMDEAEGRREAELRSVPCIGTLGLLAAAAERGLISFKEALDQLQQTNIHLSKQVVQQYVARFGEEETL